MTFQDVPHFYKYSQEICIQAKVNKDFKLCFY